METQTTTPLIYEAIINVMKDIKPIAKEKENKFYKFKYRGIEDVYKAIQPLFAKYGIFSVPKVIDISREEKPTKDGKAVYSVLTIQYKFYAKDGSFVEAKVFGEAMDSGDKSINKAMSVGHKYAIFQLFCIPTDDIQDSDADGYKITNQSNSKQDRSNNRGNNTPPPQNNYVTKAQITLIESLAKKLGCQSEQEILIRVNKWLEQTKREKIKNLDKLLQGVADSLIKALVKAKENEEKNSKGNSLSR